MIGSFNAADRDHPDRDPTDEEEEDDDEEDANDGYNNTHHHHSPAVQCGVMESSSSLSLSFLPNCPICMEEFDTNFALQKDSRPWRFGNVTVSLEHCLPISCVGCTAVICHACVMELVRSHRTTTTTATTSATQQNDKGANENDDLTSIKCPYCSVSSAFGTNWQHLNYNRAFASLLDDARRMEAARHRLERERAQERRHEHERILTLQREQEELTRQWLATQQQLQQMEREKVKEQEEWLRKHHRQQQRLITLGDELGQLYQTMEQRVAAQSSLLALAERNVDFDPLATAEILSALSMARDHVQRLVDRNHEQGWFWSRLVAFCEDTWFRWRYHLFSGDALHHGSRHHGNYWTVVVSLQRLFLVAGLVAVVATGAAAVLPDRGVSSSSSFSTPITRLEFWEQPQMTVPFSSKSSHHPNKPLPGMIAALPLENKDPVTTETTTHPDPFTPRESSHNTSSSPLALLSVGPDLHTALIAAVQQVSQSAAQKAAAILLRPFPQRI